MVGFLVVLSFIFPEERYFFKVSKELNVPLNEISLDREGFELYGYGKFRLKIFDNLIFSPVKVPSYVREMARGILNYSDSLWALSYFPFARIDEGVRRGLIQRPYKNLIDSLDEIDLNKYFNSLLKELGTKEQIMIDDTNFLKGIILILRGIKIYLNEINNFSKNISDKQIEKILKGMEEDEEGISNPEIENLIESVDFKIIARLSMDLSFYLQKGIEFIKNCELEENVEIHTDYGKVIIDIDGENIYNSPAYLLIIDYEGNDEYINCAGADKKFPLSVIVDLEGDDTYKGKPGTGICGTGILIDFKGNDVYIADKFGIGTGIFGQGIVMDYEGDDRYVCDSYGQGAGVFGTGVLCDLKGNDYYEGFQCIQGFGFVKSCGMLIDRYGNDIYIARDDTIKYPSSQTKKHNVSLAQGTGFGIRADFTDGHSLAGGVGFLIDGKGNDKYSCGVFGQGCGYWMGCGFLVDFEGDDKYKGIWYVQGACAHFALGTLIDSSGNDSFFAEINMAQGAGHDFSLGYFVDYKGNDFHEAPNLSLGAGNANGMGIFIDFEGNDEYKTKGKITLGRANIGRKGGLRDYIKCIGIFIDAKGKDKYYEEFAGNKKIWKQKPPVKPYLESEKCIGIDF